MSKRIRIAATLALTAALSAPALSFAQMSGAPVPMTDAGLIQWVNTMPTDTAIANDLFRVAQECDCPPGDTRNKANITYLDGLFHHHGYSYGASVREYLEATRGLGDYRYERTNLIEQSGIAEMLYPALLMIEQGNGAWLQEQWIMTEDDLGAAEQMLNVSQ